MHFQERILQVIRLRELKHGVRTNDEQSHGRVLRADNNGFWLRCLHLSNSTTLQNESQRRNGVGLTAISGSWYDSSLRQWVDD